MRFPEGRLLSLQARGAASLWISLHVIIGAVTRGEVLIFSTSSLVVALAMTGLLGHLDTRRRREMIFLGNLGIAPYTVPLVWISVVALLESVLALAAHAISK
jgi:hypothetical protein